MQDETVSRDGMIRTAQIIVVALVMGVVSFAVIATIVAIDEPPDQVLLSYVALAFAVVAAIMRIGIGPAIAKNQMQALDTEGWDNLDEEDRFVKLFPVFQTKLIVEDALLEGAAFFALVAYLLEGQIWTIALAAALVAGMLITFPTRTRIDDWIRTQCETIAAETNP